MTGQSVLSFRRSTKLPLILQDERAECGHACVAMISNFWGHRIDLHYLRRKRETSNRGTTLLDMIKLCEELGLVTRPLRVPLEELHLIQCPAILHWDMNHFVVLKQIKNKQAIIHDPAKGVRSCSLEEISQSFTGVVLEVAKADDFKEIRTTHKLTLVAIVKTIKGVNKYITLLLLISLSIEILSLLNPLFMQYITDNVIGYSEKSNLYVIAGGFLLLTIIHALADYIRGNMVIYFTNHLTEQFSSNVVRHLLKLPLSFFEKRHKGDLQSKFQSINDIQQKISTDFVNTVLDGFMIFINFAVMMVYSPMLTAMVVFTLSICLGLRYISYQTFKKQSEISVNRHAQAISAFLETLQGMIPIKSFLKERLRFNVWRNSYIEALNADIKVAKMNVIYQVANQLLFHVDHIIIICTGVALVLGHKFSLGMLMAFLSYRLLLVNKTSTFIQHIFDYKLISIQLQRLSDILFQEPETFNVGYGKAREIRGGLTLKNVSFAYDNQSPTILNAINLQVKAGEKIAIIGPSGSGKSTLLKVMMGLLEKTAGEIYIDTFPLSEFGLKNYRNLIASVMQDDTLLSGSILDNICFFEEEIDIERIYHAAALAHIHEEISQFPMGYETLVGDMGSTLSGGQRQRLLLARALYKQPKILFLDEATSHLDVENERKINESLKSLNITQIIIAHRQETISMADRVVDLSGINFRVLKI